MQIFIRGFVNYLEILFGYFVVLVTSVYYFIKMCVWCIVDFFLGFVCKIPFGLFLMLCIGVCFFWSCIKVYFFWSCCLFYVFIFGIFCMRYLIDFLKVFMKYINKSHSICFYFDIICILIYIYLFGLLCLSIIAFYASGTYVYLPKFYFFNLFF